MPCERPVALIILDGWGEAPAGEGNAIRRASTPTFDRIRARFPNAQLTTCGRAVGLPEGQMGNSEVGHLNIGAGFVVEQELTRIDEAIERGELATNEALRAATERAASRDATVHLIGLLGTGGVHAHTRHIVGLLRMLSETGLRSVAVHLMTDGRDTPPKSALGFLDPVRDALSDLPRGRIASVSGRYYGMDRDERWDRTKRAWHALVDGEGHTARSAAEAVKAGYERGETDEFIEPTVIVDSEGQPVGRVRAEDVAILFNFRADRMRQLLRALRSTTFDAFERRGFPEGGYDVVTMTEYIDDQDAPVAFPPQDVEWPLARVISDAGLRQFHAAETEKYAHVTYFINGGREAAFHGEDRLIVPSPDVATYDLQPEMSAYPLTDRICERVRSIDDHLLIINYANPDMVGHTGDIPAAIRAVEAVDGCLDRLLDALAERDAVAIVTADHGNAEMMIDPETGSPHTAHTKHPVPIVLVGDGLGDGVTLRDGRLSDVAPTVLELLEIPAPDAMTGTSLIRRPT